MVTSSKTIAETYVKLALAFDRHMPGYVDAYYGPPKWLSQSRAGDPCSLEVISLEADSLAAAIIDDDSMDPQRQDYLTHEARALQTITRLLQGHKLGLVEEVEGLYDVTPIWVDEGVFEEACRVLDELLPPGSSLDERINARNSAMVVPVKSLQPVLLKILVELRRRTRERFPLPHSEDFELEIVRDEQPYAAYNKYLGDYRSHIDVNTVLPLHLIELVAIMAHEGYPGHHTEQAIKEALLTRGQGRIEHCLVMTHSPSCVIQEGIARHALKTLIPLDELVEWYQSELFPMAGLDKHDARRELAVETILGQLEDVFGNVALMLHDQHATEEQAMDYIQRYKPGMQAEARAMIKFINWPLRRSYIFTYLCGHKLLDNLFATKDNCDAWFLRLLSEPVTPSQLRSWIAS